MAPMAGAPDASLLLILGADRDDRIVRKGTQVVIRGASDIHRLLDNQITFHRLHVTRNYFRQQRRPELAAYRCIVNLITEPEQNSQVLDNVRRLVRGLPAKLLNRPEAVLASARERVARQLEGVEGLLVPKALRLRAAKPGVAIQAATRAGLSFPAILREAGTHTGKTTALVKHADEICGAMTPGVDHIATEWVDFRSKDGLYRKYRVFFLGQHRIFRHMLVSDEWNVHARDRRRFMLDRPELLEEEDKLFARPEGAFAPEVDRTLRQVRERMKLDFFGMDFGLMPDGRVVLFEANATMNFFPFLPEPEFAYIQKCLAPAQGAFRELVGLQPARQAAGADLQPSL